MGVDEDLLTRARQWECEAARGVATRWWTPVFRFAWNMLANAAQAAAVTEETVFVLLTSPPCEVPVRTLVYRLALQFCVLRRSSIAPIASSRSHVREVLRRLEAKDRAALLLRDVEGLAVGEVAAILRTSPTEVRSRAHRARLFLLDATRSTPGKARGTG